jgi:hypothetical protein
MQRDARELIRSVGNRRRKTSGRAPRFASRAPATCKILGGRAALNRQRVIPDIRNGSIHEPISFSQHKEQPMKYLLQKSFALAALSLMCVQPVFAMTLTEAKAKCTSMKGVFEVYPDGVGYVCKGNSGVLFSSPTAVVPRSGLIIGPQSTPQTTPQAAPTPVVPRVGLIKGGTLWLSASRPSYQNARLVTRPGVIGASMEVTCEGGKTFTVSTGDNGGACGATIGENGSVAGGSCGSASGSGGGSASVDCNANSGQGACTGSSGSGSCGETRP